MSYFQIEAEKPFPLPKLGALPSTVHVFSQTSIDALDAALAANRPLLIRGEPGTGKSQLARAAAVALNRALITTVIDARTEARDLLWSFDAVARLAEAQVQGALDVKDEAKVREQLKETRFLAPGPLWWAFHWNSAKTQAKEVGAPAPVEPKDWQPDQGTVLLIDEIDKADTAVPNGLLEALGAGRFTGPGGVEVAQDAESLARPLVILTTNEDRALPDAFLRRCLVLQLKWPEEESEADEFIRLLMQRGEAHFPELSPEIRREAAEQLLQDRKVIRNRGLFPPGGAEYLDLLRALDTLTRDREMPLEQREELQKEWLIKIRDFALRKHPEDSPW